MQGKKKSLGLLAGLGTLFVASSAIACPDTNGDDVVDVQDLTNVILDWGTDGSANGGDATEDGTVDVQDLTLVILSWGPFECPADCEVEPGAPANDCCGTAEVVVGALVSIPFDTTNANTDGPQDANEPCSSNNDGAFKDIWYSYTPAEDGLLVLGNCNAGDFDSKLYVYEVPEGGDPCDANTLIANTVACNDDCPDDTTIFTSELEVDVIGGVEYLVRMGGFSPSDESEAEFGTGTLTFNLVTDNSICSAADLIATGDVVEDSTCDSEISADAPTCAGGIAPAKPGRWYRIIGDGNTLTVTTCGTEFNGTFGTSVDIYCAGAEGVECAGVECIGSTSPACNLFFNEQEFCTIEGNEYIIHVYGNPALPDDCGDFLLGVTSDGAPCIDFTECDQPSCAEPNVATGAMLAQATLVNGSPLGITQDPNTGIIYVLDLFAGQWEAFLYDHDAGTLESQELVNHGVGPTDGPPFASGIAYDNVNNTLWIMVAQDQEGDVGFTMHEVNLDGSVTGATISDPDFAGLAADVEHDPITDTFWFVDIVGDQLTNISRAGAVIDVIPQSCLPAEVGGGVFGNSVTVFTDGSVEVLTGDGSNVGLADRAVPIDTSNGDTIGCTLFECPNVTFIDGEVIDSDFTSGICRSRLVPNVMFVSGSGEDNLTAIQAADLP